MQSLQTDQMYESSLLLGALLNITGLSIIDVQNIIRGDLKLGTPSSTIRTTILENSEWRTTFCFRAKPYNITLNDLNEVFDVKISESEFNGNIYNFNFYFNTFNFSLKQTQEVRKKLVLLLRNKYNLNNNQIAVLLDVSPATIGKI